MDNPGSVDSGDSKSYHWENTDTRLPAQHEAGTTHTTGLFQRLLSPIYVCASVKMLFFGGAFASLVKNLGRQNHRGFFMARWQSDNAAVCKTVFRRFESGPSLQFRWMQWSAWQGPRCLTS